MYSGFSPLQLSVGILQAPSILPLSYVGIHAPFVRVFGVADVSQIEGLERNLFGTAQPMLDQVRARELALAGKGIATKQIVRRAIFLDENDHMLNQPAECYGFADSMPRTRGMCIKSKQR